MRQRPVCRGNDRVACAGSDCVKFGTNRPVQAQAVRFELAQDARQAVRQRRLCRGVIRAGNEAIALHQQPAAQFGTIGRAAADCIFLTDMKLFDDSVREVHRLARPSAAARRCWRGCAAVLLAPRSRQASRRAQTAYDSTIVDAREAFRRRDRDRLAAARAAQAIASRHPLAMWPDYWDMNLRLPELTDPDVDAFYRRWPGTLCRGPVAQRLAARTRRRRDWLDFAADKPRFRMNDDRDVHCYALLIEQQRGPRRARCRPGCAVRAADGRRRLPPDGRIVAMAPPASSLGRCVDQGPARQRCRAQRSRAPGRRH